jgi:hypothetical protein
VPTNEAITSSLVFNGQVPPDLECQISSLSEIVRGVVAVTSIQTTNPDGNPSPPDDSVAQQALSTANAALALAQSVQASQKQWRASVPQSVPTGDSSISFPFASPMPSVSYSILLTIYAGTTTHPAAYYGVRVLESSITVNGFTILADNIPASSKIAYHVIEI